MTSWFNRRVHRVALKNSRWLSVPLVVFFSFVGSLSIAQNQSNNDTTKTLNEVVVNAYQYNRSLKETPVAIGLVTQNELNRFSTTSVVSAMNTIPGVRMEERSPGSYRFSVRGSTLRSPFGIREVKFYWNGLPFTDGGGNTYLNLLDFDAFGRAEIVKGPGASLYGAGTGGVVLLNNPFANQNQIQVSVNGGSFGLQRYQLSSTFGNSKAKFFVNYAHQQADGYRHQSAMQRDAVNAEGKFSLSEKSLLQASLFYTDLYYQTPGGLTLSQYNADPQQARPSSKTAAGAVQQQAAVFNKTIYAALNFERQWQRNFSTRIGAYGAYTDFTNPSILNYERRTENNFGGRTDTQYEIEKSEWKVKFTAGAEYQHFYSPLTDYGNRSGVKDTVQTDDRLTSDMALAFVQAEFSFPKKFYLTLGSSGNFINYKFERLAGTPSGNYQRKFDPVVSPRLALIKKFSESFSAFGSIAKGFSAPSLAEVRPSSGVYNNTLSPEQGINYELGIRGSVFRNFSFDVVGYDFELTQSIVSEKNIYNADYFVNAGRTSKKGAEVALAFQKALSSRAISFFKVWIAYTLTNYKFTNYQHDGVNYSGNRWTGSPLNTLVAGIDLNFLKHFYWNATTNYVDCIPLNDANSIYASSYFLIGSRLGYKTVFSGKTGFEIFAGVDNALDQRYSLGNDLNAAAGRYFNAAATRNFYFGLKIIPRLK
ncbi:MAG TPA: TonB-dependent receptor [Cytophagales bacterium]|jgi:iron complex outermembrane recepter protein|nr:TonB-dependent receptor [Cytophagales bacterium]